MRSPDSHLVVSVLRTGTRSAIHPDNMYQPLATILKTAAMDTIPKTLFRGDKFGNSTKPEFYRTNELLTKQINSGDPAYIQKMDY